MKGRRKESLSNCGKGCRAGAPSFPELQKKLLLDKQASPIETCSAEAVCLARNLGNGADSSKRLLPSDYLSKTTPTPQKNILPSACRSCRGADRVVLAQPHVDDPQDTDLQEHEKSLHGKTPFIRANSTITVPQVEVNAEKPSVPILKRGLNLVI